jgi:hypothetical protein
MFEVLLLLQLCTLQVFERLMPQAVHSLHQQHALATSQPRGIIRSSGPQQVRLSLFFVSCTLHLLCTMLFGSSFCFNVFVRGACVTSSRSPPSTPPRSPASVPINADSHRTPSGCLPGD